MKMSDKEDLDDYLSKFFDMINNLKSLGEEVAETRIVQKLLMSLNRRYNSIVSIIEETRDIETLRAEEVVASVKVFDRREGLSDERDKQKGFEKAFSSLKLGSKSKLWKQQGLTIQNSTKLARARKKAYKLVIKWQQQLQFKPELQK